MRLVIQHLVKDFPDTSGASVRVLNGINLTIEAGQRVGIVGPSGCGKSTLLNIIAGVENPSSGSVNFESKTRGGSCRLGYVFQSPRLLNWRTVWENVALVLPRSGRTRSELRLAAGPLLNLVGVENLAEEFPLRISGGEQARVALARAFAREPELILLDEPFSHLDPVTAAALREKTVTLCKSKNLSMLLVTHNAREAVQMANSVHVLSAKPTTLVETVTIDTSDTPAGSDLGTLEERVLGILQSSVEVGA